MSKLEQKLRDSTKLYHLKHLEPTPEGFAYKIVGPNSLDVVGKHFVNDRELVLQMLDKTLSRLNDFASKTVFSINRAGVDKGFDDTRSTRGASYTPSAMRYKGEE